MKLTQLILNIKKEIIVAADNSGETTPFDWYNARLSVNFKVDKLLNHAAIALNDNIGTVNGSNTLIKKIQVKAEGIEVYDCDLMQIIA